MYEALDLLFTVRDRKRVEAGEAVADDPTIKGPLWKPGEGFGAFWRGLITWNRDHQSSFRTSVVTVAGLAIVGSGSVVHGVRLWVGWGAMAAFGFGRLWWLRRRLQRPYRVPEAVDGKSGSWW